MCGIVGILSQTKRDLVTDVIQSLSDLEYRGYDSAGIAVRTAGGIRVHKCLGAPSAHMHVDDVYRKMRTKEHNVSAIIGHNRWATHGKPSINNAHPHADCNDKIVVVHNGTILNYSSLKEGLVRRGHRFHSETDTEVIAHAIEETLKYGNNFETAFVQALNMLDGSFAIVAMYVGEPEKLYIAKNGSPLNIGITEDSFVVTSSTNPLVRYTSTFISLADKEFAVLKAQKNNLSHHIFKFRNTSVGPVHKKPRLLEDIQVDDIGKGSYETHMLKEIFEQPATTRAALLGRYDVNKGDAVLGGVVDYDDVLARIRQIVITGCGTAHNAGLIGKEIIERLTNIQVTCDIASEYKYRPKYLPMRSTLVTAVSQSGETADTLSAIAEARNRQYKVCGIVNAVGSTMTNISDFGIYTRVGPEIGVASTKAFTGQLATFYLLALYLARQRAMTSTDGNSYLECLLSIPDLMNKTLTLSETIKKCAEKFKKIKSVAFVGRGVHVPIAHEAALKFKELTYMEAGSYPMGELKHGPIAVVDQNSLTVLIMPKDELFDISQNAVEQIKSKGGKVAIITDSSARNRSILQKADAVIQIPHLSHTIFYPLLEVIPLQLFAYYFAKQLGRDVDKPRNLAKSVTVE